MKTWITVRMEDGGIVDATLHASEEYQHPHPDYADGNPLPTAHVSIVMVTPPAVQKALQAAIDGARAQLASQARIAAAHAMVRAAEAAGIDLEDDEDVAVDDSGPDKEVRIRGRSTPTGTNG